MGVTHVMQLPQRLPHLPHSDLEHFFTKGRRANRAPKEAEAITNNRNLRWQEGKGGIKVTEDEEEGLAPV